MLQFGLLVLAVSALTATDAFMPQQHLVQSRHFAVTTSTAGSSSLQMAGFGAGAPKKKKGGTKEIKLKPKAQWSRFKDLKTEDVVRVAVRIINDDDAEEKWYQVGAIKSKDNAYMEAAVTRHRVLIADHARRMFPVQISPKDRLEWAYCSSTATDDADWVMVAAKVENMPDDIEKLSGFEGLADPSGFYARSTEKLGYITMPQST